MAFFLASSVFLVGVFLGAKSIQAGQYEFVFVFGCLCLFACSMMIVSELRDAIKEAHSK